MTMTQRELKEIEDRLDAGIEKTIAPMTEALHELTTQIALMLQRLDHQNEHNKRTDESIAKIDSQNRAIEISVAELQTKQDGIIALISKIGLPVSALALLGAALAEIIGG